MRKILLTGTSLAVMLMASNALAVNTVIDEDTVLTENFTAGNGDTFKNENNALYGFDAADAEANRKNVTFEDGSSADLTGDGSKSSGIAALGQLNVTGGTINVSNTGSDKFDNTTQFAGYRGVTVSGGEINLGKGTAMFTGAEDNTTGSVYNMELSGGTVNLDGGVLLTTSNASNTAKLNISGSTVNANSGLIVAKETNVTDGELNVNGALKLQANKAGDAEGGLNVSGGKFNMNNADIDAGKVAVNITGGENIASGNNIFNGEMNIETAGNLTVAKDSSLSFNGGELNIAGDKASGAPRNGIYGELTSEGLPQGTVNLNGSAVNITAGGTIEVADLNINGGEISVSGKGSNMTTTQTEWRKGSIMGGYDSVNINDGKITLSDNGQLMTDDHGSINLNGGEIALGGNGLLRAANNVADASSAINVNGGKISVTGTDNTIDSANTVINSGSLEVAKDAGLKLVAMGADDNDSMADADGKINLAGGEIANHGQIDGTVEQNGGTYTGFVDSQITKLIVNSGKAILGAANPVTNALMALANVTGVAGDVSVNGGSVEVLGTVDNLSQTAGTVDAKDGGIITAAAINGGSLNIADGASVGTADLDGGTINIASSSTAQITTLNLNDGTVNNNGTIAALNQEGGNFNAADGSAISGAAAINAGSFNVAEGAGVTAGSVTVADGAEVNLGAASVLSGDVILNDGANLKSEVKTSGMGSIDGKLTANGNNTVKLVIENGADLDNMQIASSIDGAGADAVKVEGNALYDTEGAVLGADGKLSGVEKNSADKAAANLVNEGVDAQNASIIGAFATLTGAGATGDAIASAMSSDIQNGNYDSAARAADGLAPIDLNSVNTASVQNTTEILNAVNNQLNGVKSAAGKSSGDAFSRVSTWVQGLFNKSHYSKDKGYKTENTGVAFGVDKQVADDVKIGAGYAYNSGNIKSQDKKIDVDTHTAILYGQYKPSDFYYNGVATYNWSDNEAKSSSYGMPVHGKYDVDTIGIQAMAGYDAGIISPEAGLRYFRVSQDGYKDTAGQSISKNTFDTLTAVVGAKAEKEFALDNGMILKPNARLAATYDLVADDASGLVSLPNGSTYVVNGEKLDRFGIEAGVGLAAEISDNVELSAAYEGRFRNDFKNHTGLLEAKYKF